MYSEAKKRQIKQYIPLTILCGLFFVGLFGCSVPPPAPQHYVAYSTPYLSLHVCLDNTQSYPGDYLKQAAQNISDRINSYIAPGIAGGFISLSLIEASSVDDSFVSFSLNAIPNIHPKPDPSSYQSPYDYATALKEWKREVAKINSLVASERARIKPYLEKLTAISLKQSDATDILGCADTYAGEVAHAPISSNKILLYVSDMQNNVDLNFSKHINLLRAKIVVAFMPCQVESACEQLRAYYARQFKVWNASSVEYYSPAESSAEHITGF